LENGASVLDLVLAAGAVAKIVLLLLLLCSVLSWAIILSKGLALRKANDQNRQFLTLFARAENLAELQRRVAKLRDGPMVALFRSCLPVIEKKGPVPVAYLERLLQSGIQDEMGYQERSIHILATIGNTSPFVGLFGTVWGIMGAFQEIGRQGTANIASVGPGVAEALVTTAAGLLAAIPAVVAYNLFVNRLREMELQLDLFASEIIRKMETEAATPVSLAKETPMRR